MKKENVPKENDMKARSMLLMALPNEHLMTFNQYKNAKTLFAAIQTRLCGNEATKKTQKTLLKQMYENFSAPSIESFDSIFNRLQKIWNIHIVVWRNKPNLDTMSFDDLYNNFKIVEQEVKRTASSRSSSQNVAFVLSTSSTNEVNTAHGVSTANSQVSPASTQVSTTSTQVRIYQKSNKIVKNRQARARESEENKKKPKNQSRSQKVKDRSQIQSTWSTTVIHYKTKPHNNPILVP
ncbi:hypothetical protein Tco_0087261 [Tanacetum coccineum]